MTDLDYKYRFVSYGVVCEISSNDERLLKDAVSTADRSLLGNLKLTKKKPVCRIVVERTSRSYYRITRNEQRLASGSSRRKFLKFFDSIVRVSIGESAPDHLFIHAGAVAWKGKGIILPADSFKGKSTLVTELVNAGATYYSDDFAIIDREGALLPFARDISMRTKDGTFRTYEIEIKQNDIPIGNEPIPVSLVLFTEYKKNARFVPRTLTIGEGIMELIKYTLTFQSEPERSIKGLKHMLDNSVSILSGSRGSAKNLVKSLLDFVDKTTN